MEDGEPVPVHQRQQVSPAAAEVGDPPDAGEPAPNIRRRLRPLQRLQLGRDTQELPARVVPLLQPVGEDQPQAVVVGALQDGLDEGVFVGHGGLRPAG